MQHFQALTSSIFKTQSTSSGGRDTGILVTWLGKKQSVSFVSPSAIAGRFSNHDAHCKASKSITFAEAVEDAIKVAGLEGQMEAVDLCELASRQL